MIAQIIALVLIIVGVGLDQLSKFLIVSNVELGEAVDLIPGVLKFQLDYNTGMAFGWLQGEDQRWIFLSLSTVAIIAIFVYMFWKKPQDKLLLSALILMQAGGIGNMIDRVFLGQVTDFIYFCAFPKIWRYIFNVADSFVCVGAGLLMLWMVLDLVRDIKREKAQSAEALKEGNDDAE